MNITVLDGAAIPAKEQHAYWEHAEAEARKQHRKVAALSIRIDPEDPDYVLLDAEYVPIRFERLRRITGYLVGTLDRFNDAKAAEERERVKHG